MPTAEAPEQVPSSSLRSRITCWRERTPGRATNPPGPSRQAGMLLPARSAPDGHSRRNAVGRVGVKLIAAPDAPHWGVVLVRTASGRFSSGRVRTASTFTCLSREHPTCPARPRDPGRGEPRPRWPASSGGGGRGGRVAGQPRAGLRTARYPAWAPGQAERAAITARTTRQRASTGRTGGRRPHPGKDPL
jgi:hypothetical protein